MKTYHESITLKSSGFRPTFHQITDQVNQAAGRAEVKEGICVVYTHHTTCSVMIQECSIDRTYNGLEYLQQDLWDVFEQIIPTCRAEGQYRHPGPELTEFSRIHGEGKPETLNTDAHLRSAFLGRSEVINIADGKVDLGSFGHVYFVDFDQTHARERLVEIRIMGE